MRVYCSVETVGAALFSLSPATALLLLPLLTATFSLPVGRTMMMISSFCSCTRARGWPEMRLVQWRKIRKIIEKGVKGEGKGAEMRLANRLKKKKKNRKGNMYEVKEARRCQ